MKRVAVASLLLAMVAPGFAQTGLADPTRPPAVFQSESAAAQTPGVPVLQSVLLPKKGRAMAVIGGQPVFLGGMYGESRLVRLTEREAVLEGPGGVEHLPLTPGIEKTNVVMKNTGKTAAPRRAQSEGKL